MTRLRALGVALWAALLAPAALMAQDGGFSLGQDVDAVDAPAPLTLRTLDEEALFRMSAFGQRVASEIETASRALEAENERLTAMLTQREIELTNLRTTMLPQEFRAAADAFDQEAEGIRRSQAQKRERLLQYEAAEQRRFFLIGAPVLEALLTRIGAQVLIDSRAVIVGAERIDITEDALEAIDAAIGDGGPAPFALDVP